MPFQWAGRPSIQVGLLRAIAQEAGFATDSYHFTLDLAAELSPTIYEPLANHRGRMTGDWLFSVAAFGDGVDADDSAYFEAFPDEITAVARATGVDSRFLSRLRHEVLPRFVDACADRVDWSRYGVVGFTSSFQQNVASLALARRIKRRHPEVCIVFGGANYEHEMGLEYVRVFPWIDVAVVGEGDIAFPSLLRCLTDGGDPTEIAGVAIRRNGGVAFAGAAAPTTDLDALPVPDYSEYFERASDLGLGDGVDFGGMIPVESSRGCWWGAKHHCTFCGLNGLGMAFRSKGPDRFLAELNELARRHRITSFEAVDNIVDFRYVHGLFDAVAKSRSDFNLFYEVKANLTREQLGALYRGGVREIQPGIESMSTHVLALMRKGCTMLQNVRLLKWAQYYGIRVGWNLLHGFPGEREDDYAEQLEVLKVITHLQPPTGGGRIWLERFSPYFTDRDSYPIHDVRPEPSYAYAYPAGVGLDRIAYFFDYRMDDTLPEASHHETSEFLEEWRRTWTSPERHTLTYRRTPDQLFVDDDRGPDKRGTYAFDEPLATIYELCGETARTAAHVLSELAWEMDEADVRWALDEFCRRGLMVSEDARYLSLALPVNPNW